MAFQFGLPTIIGDFKVLVIGPSGVGKTTFIKRHATGDFSSQYTPTTTAQTTPISFHMVGDDVGGEAGVDDIVQLNVVDHADGESWNQADAAIFMFDLANPNSFDPAMTAFHLFRVQFPSVPTVFVGSKHDISNGNFLEQFTWSIVWDEERQVISSKTNFDYEKPFLYLIRQLLGNETLNFAEMPVVTIPPHLEEQLLQELAVAGVTPLPYLPDIEENDESQLSYLDFIQSLSDSDYDVNPPEFDLDSSSDEL
uniref:Ras family GTPase n=1 Tax=Marseillevirus LCMAC101 TaxID=2506602 RepID=A0A481YSP9_9VIRU|nr:MAG: Ras family GTPase [Marseillevirus LCMAC101]